MKYNIYPLLKSEYEGYELLFEYETSHYYDAEIFTESEKLSATFTKKAFDAPVKKKFKDKLFAPYWEGSEAYGVFADGKFIACLEIWKEEWSNRLRVTELWVEDGYRRNGIGKELMNLAKQRAAEKSCRAVILETQSCNENAIAFYIAQGFTLFGFDSSCYGNNDVEKREVRIELGLYL